MVKISRSRAEQIAIWRLGILGRVLSNKPDVVKPCLVELANQKDWRHPISGEVVELKLRTLQRWYTKASTAHNAMSALMPAIRKDKGKSQSLSEEFIKKMKDLYAEYAFWSWKLLHDNMAAVLRSEQINPYIPSYATLRRYLLLHQMRPIPRRDRRTQEALHRKKREGSPLFEVEYVGALWQTD